jgi:hypothetical protein
VRGLAAAAQTDDPTVDGPGPVAAGAAGAALEVFEGACGEARTGAAYAAAIRLYSRLGQHQAVAPALPALRGTWHGAAWFATAGSGMRGKRDAAATIRYDARIAGAGTGRARGVWAGPAERSTARGRAQHGAGTRAAGRGDARRAPAEQAALCEGGDGT